MVTGRRLRLPQFSLGGLQPSGLRLSWGLALSSTLAFSLATPLARLTLDLGVDPTTLLVLRFTLAIGLLAGTLRLIAPDKLWADRRGVLIAYFAGLENGIGVLCFFWALTRLEASVATMIFTLNPLLILGLLALRGERLTYRHWLRIGLGLAGVFFVIGPAGQIDWLGVLLLGITIGCIALEFVIIQWYLQPYDSRTVTLYVLSGMLTTIFGYWLWQGPAWQAPSGPAWLYIILLAVVCTYFAWWAMFSSIRYIGSGQVAMLVPLETLLTVLWSFMLLGERFSPGQYVGAGLILLSTGLAVQRLGQLRKRLRWRAGQRL